MESNKANNDNKLEPKIISQEIDYILTDITKNILKLNDQKNFIKALKTKLEKEDFPAIITILDEKNTKELQQTFPKLVEILAQLKIIAQRKIETMIQSFDNDLREHLAKIDLKKEWWFPDTIAGKFPEYNINKTIRVLVNTKNLSATVNDQAIRTISIEEITAKIIAENNRLFGRPFNGQRFIDQLYNAYEKTCLKNRKPVGELVHLKEVYTNMVFETQRPQFFDSASKSNFQPYLLDEFTVDLSRYLKIHPTVSKNGVRPELHPLRDSRDALYITLPNGEQVYKGLISFTRAQT